jgi:hypothetical protein
MHMGNAGKMFKGIGKIGKVYPVSPIVEVGNNAIHAGE